MSHEMHNVGNIVNLSDISVVTLIEVMIFEMYREKVTMLYNRN